MITSEDIQENTHLFSETFTGTFASNKCLLRNRYGRAAIPRWNVALKNGKTMSLYQTLVAGMRSKNRTLKQCKDLVKEATDKDDREALVGLFEIVKREQPPLYDQMASKFALCRSLSGLRTSWWCNGLVSKILKRVDDLEADIFCTAWCHPWDSSRRNLKKALDSLEKQMDIKVFENFQRLYNAFASAQKEALSSRVGKFKVKVQPRESAEGLVHCTLELDENNKSLVVSGKDGEIVARIHDDGFAVVKNKPKYIDFLSKLNDDDEEGSFLNYVFQNVCSCVFCGRNLTVGTSIAQGAGDICYGRYGTRWKQTMAEENTCNKPVYTPGCFVDHLATQEVRDAAGRTATLPTILCIASPVIRMFAEDSEDQNTEVLEYLGDTFTEDQLKTLAYYMETWLVYPFSVFGEKEPEYKLYGLEYSSIYRVRQNRPTYHIMPVEPDNEIQQELLQHLTQHPRQASRASFDCKREGFVLGYMMNVDMLKLIDYLDIPFVCEHILFQMEPLYHASMLQEYLNGNSSEIEIQLQEKKKIDKNAPKKPKSAYKFFQITKETVQTLKSKFLEAHGLDPRDTTSDTAIKLLYTDGNGTYQYPRKREHPIRGTVFAEWYAKELPTYWKSLSDEEKKPFVDMAAADKSRYDTEMEDYEPPAA